MPTPGTTSELRTVSTVEPDWRFRVVLAAAVAGVVFLHAVWLIIATNAIDVNPSMATLRSSAPVISYLGHPDLLPRGAADDVRQVRSPVLFALPTHVGFSGPLLADAQGLAPPSMVPDEPPRIRVLDEPFTASPFGASLRDMKQLIKSPRIMPVPYPSDESPPLTAPSGVVSNTLMVYWMDRPDQQQESIPAYGTDNWVGRVAWEMVLFVCFDSDGLIRQVMIEKPSPYQDVTAAVLRIARGMTFGAPLYDDCGRLVVVYHPPAGGRAE